MALIVKRLSDYVSLASAVATIGSEVTQLIIDKADALAASVSTPSTLHCVFVSGGIITTTGFTLTFGTEPEIGLTQAFAGTGTVSGLYDVRPEWWGNDSVAMQAALTCLLVNGGVLECAPNKTYTMTDYTLTLLRSSSGHAKQFLIKGNGATFYFPANTTGNLLSVGATAVTYFGEGGMIDIENLVILGPETGTPYNAATPDTSCIGLNLQYAANVSLRNVNVSQCYTGIKTFFTFSLQADSCNVRNNFIGLHCDAVSNIHQWNRLIANQCRQSVLIQRNGVAGTDSIHNITFNSLWVETSQNAVHIDPGVIEGVPRINRISFRNCYFKGLTYDVFRIGMPFDFATPQTRQAVGVSPSQVYGVEFDNCNWPSSAYTASKAALVFPATSTVRAVYGNVSIPYSANAVVNTPCSSVLAFLDDESSWDQNHTYYRWDYIGVLVGTWTTNGGMTMSSMNLNALTAEPSDKTTGMICRADRATWDPLSKGSGGSYLAWYNGSAWKLLNEQ